MNSLTGFVTIVGLLCNYIGLKGGNETADFQEFLKWLTENNHREVKSAIESNQKTAISIKTLLTSELADLKSMMCELDVVLSSISAQIPVFHDLASSINQDSYLSEQALDILRQMDELDADFFLVSDTMAGLRIIPSSGGSKGIEFKEKRFIKDDIENLVSLGLLKITYTRSGTENYNYTRAADKLVKASCSME